MVKLKKYDRIFQKYMERVEEYTYLTGSAKCYDKHEIRKITRLVEKIEKIIKTKLKYKIDGSETTQFIGSWKVHKIMHVSDCAAYFGFVGLADEQSVEKIHQQANELLRVICSLNEEHKNVELMNRLQLRNLKYRTKSKKERK